MRGSGLAGAARVLDNRAHPGVAEVVARFAENPDARRVHDDDGGDALGRTEAQRLDLCLGGDGSAIEREHLKLVAREREPMRFSGAGVENVKEHALALAHLDGRVVAEHAAVD